MKIILLCLAVLLSAGCAHFEDRGKILQEHIKKRDCRAAENYARNMSGDDGDRNFGLGIVYIDCYRKRKEGVEYLKLAALSGNKLAADALIQIGEKLPVAAPPTAEQELQQCFTQARRQEQSCALTAYGGVSSIGNPVVRERQQVCTDRRMSAEEHCLRMHKPSALQGVPARIPVPQPAQPQQIIIQKQAPLPALPNVGPIIPGPTPYGR
jgi:hypothetical protein